MNPSPRRRRWLITASARAQRVRDQLISAGHIGVDRLFLAQSTDPAKQNKGPRVFLNLQ